LTAAFARLGVTPALDRNALGFLKRPDQLSQRPDVIGDACGHGRGRPERPASTTRAASTGSFSSWSLLGLSSRGSIPYAAERLDVSFRRVDHDLAEVLEFVVRDDCQPDTDAALGRIFAGTS